MDLRTTAILAILFAAIAGYLYFVEMGRDPDQEASSKALTFDKAAVSRIELEHPGRKVVLQHDGESWQMIEPVEAAADQRNVANLLDTLEECEIKRTLEDAGELPTYGLDFPSATVRIAVGDDTVGVIKVGKKTPVGGSAYILRNDDDSVHLTDGTLLDRIDKKVADLRDKTVLDFDKADVRSIGVRSARGEVALEKSDESWTIDTPASFSADGTQVGSFLSTLESLRATDFVTEESDNLARYGLEQPRITITLGVADGDPIQLRVGSELEGKLRVQTNRRDTVYAVAAWAMDGLDRGVADFRDKTIARFAAEDAAEIEIESSDGSRIALKKSDDGWTAAAGEPTVKQSAVEDLVRELSELTGFEIAADAPENLADLGLDPARRMLRVHDVEGELLAAVMIGSHTVGAEVEHTARAEGATTVFHIRPFVYERINQGSSLFEERDDSEGAAAPVPNGDTGNGVDDEALDDTAAAGEEG